MDDIFNESEGVTRRKRKIKSTSLRSVDKRIIAKFRKRGSAEIVPISRCNLERNRGRGVRGARGARSARGGPGRGLASHQRPHATSESEAETVSSVSTDSGSVQSIPDGGDNEALSVTELDLPTGSNAVRFSTSTDLENPLGRPVSCSGSVLVVFRRDLSRHLHINHFV